MSTTSDLMGQGMPAALALNLGTVIDAKLASAGGAISGAIAVTGSVSATANVSGKYIQGSVGNALSGAGTTRADATALTNSINNVATMAASTGVILPASATIGIGGSVIVFNGGSNAGKVYAAGSDTIDTIAGTTGVSLTNAKRCMYIVVAANTIISAQLGVVSA
tara:strand:+ start:582 stop:1076 length:495 start_codon:yes stop_codon:yes gene_type:complete